MPRGGTREGSGRKKGATTVKKVDAEVINAGILPLEMRLTASRHLWDLATDKNGNITDIDKAKEAAEFGEPAMRFTSPALTAVAHTVTPGSKLIVEHHRRVSAEIKELLAEEIVPTGPPVSEDDD